MKKISAIIIDDSKNIIETLTLMLNEYFNDTVELKGTYTSPVEGLKKVIDIQPDILFLDVEMPNLSGFDLAYMLPKGLDTKIIMITGNEKHALAAIKHSVFDFIVKPISFVELKTAIEKVNLTIKKSFNEEEFDILNNKLIVNRHDKVLFLDLKQIIKLEADSSYTDIYYDDKKIRATKSFKFYEDKLPNQLFIKVNRSCLVNISYISEIVKQDGNRCLLLKDNTKINLSKDKQNEFIKSLLEKMNDHIF
jgi:two-component system LytT family response regulator